MDEPGFTGGFLSASRVAIWGLGLMGGSLALSLHGKCSSLVGIDPDPDTVRLALERGIVDEAGQLPFGLLDGADLIILAAPVRAIIQQLALLDSVCAASAVVLDLGSTKEQIVQAMDGLPARFDPLGGHPMCGKEKSSLVNAEAGLFHNAPFALVPLPRTTPRARALAEETARAVGACPLWIEASRHDRWVAATSHLPFLLASALALASPREARPLVGPGWRGTARLAGSSPRMMADILATNRANVRSALRLARARLDQYEQLLERGDFEALEALIGEGKTLYEELL